MTVTVGGVGRALFWLGLGVLAVELLAPAHAVRVAVALVVIGLVLAVIDTV